MKNKNLIHIRLNHTDAIMAKKDILSSQLGLLKIVKMIKSYKILRLEELQAKMMLHRRLAELSTTMRKFKSTLPKVEMPEMLKEHEEIAELEEKETEDVEYDKELEIQLKDIQNKLSELEK